ncbi:hypothetical protein FOE78_05530 [Microlunatus elymi]|uniref:Uncharacterized protein n=1 Tax=Microlunatus elymi TaxID=2596828 RepID=A0A516PWA4_9ACTN|nr:hypothetical protein [Microlunatus elymi]QDP95439.1 hypothetical protein FOE78_05530 [Microlunatus elymi]
MATKKELTLVGFPAEQTPEDDWRIERLLGRSSSPPRPDEDRIVGYLRNAPTYIASPGVTFDLLDGNGPIGTGTILTDGEFAWPDDLPHYLETYHIELPQPFTDAIVAADFVPPSLTVQQLRGITLPEMA